MAKAPFPSEQALDGFAITPSDSVDIKNDPGNYRRVESVFVHNPDTGGTVRVMPAGQPLPAGFTLTGTSGTANITVAGTAYLATFNSSLATTAANFVASHTAALTARGITVFNPTGAVLVFENVAPASLSIANATGDLSGSALAKVPITVFINQGDEFPMPVSRVYATTPTPPTGLIGLFGGARR